MKSHKKSTEFSADCQKFCGLHKSELFNYFLVRNEQEVREYVNSLTPDQVSWYLSTIIQDGHICVSSKPVSENLDIFKLDALYNEFPFIQQVYLEMPQKDSNGNLRFVKSIRRFVPGIKYMYRLKQFAEEKFSVTNLAATTIKNENTRSHAYG